MESLRIKKGIEIEVNDNGDTIVLEVEDLTFTDRFIALLDKLDAVSEEIEGLTKDMTPEEVINFHREKMEQLIKDVDEFIGDDTCKKVFGENVIPTVYAFIEFFTKLTPIISKYSEERDKKLFAEYSPNRKGGKK